MKNRIRVNGKIYEAVNEARRFKNGTGYIARDLSSKDRRTVEDGLDSIDDTLKFLDMILSGNGFDFDTKGLLGSESRYISDTFNKLTDVAQTIDHTFIRY